MKYGRFLLLRYTIFTENFVCTQKGVKQNGLTHIYIIDRDIVFITNIIYTLKEFRH